MEPTTTTTTTTTTQPPHQRRATPEYTVEVLADAACVKDVAKAILHTIFFHRYFPSISPMTRDLLDLTLPRIDDGALDALLDQRVQALVRAMDAAPPPPPPHRGRGQVVVQFFEKQRRRKTYFSFGRADEQVCWERWTVDVVVAAPGRTEADVLKVRRAMSKSLHRAALKIVAIVNSDKDHIPPITTTDANPFPYHVLVNPNPKSVDGWGQKMGIF